MTVYSFPSIKRPSSMTWRPIANTQTQRSPFDGTMQTLRQPGERWAATVSWETLSATEARVLSSFLTKLGGRAGRFTFSPFHAPRQATGTGTPLINGSQSGSSISIDGWANGAQAFKDGDFFSVLDSNSRPLLYQVTADVTANGSGVATVPVAPPVRRSVPDNTAVEITTPLAVFMLTEDDVGVSIRPPLLGSFSFDIIEALV